MTGYKTGRSQRALVTPKASENPAMEKLIVLRTGTYDEEYLLQKASGLGRERIAERSGKQLGAVLIHET